VKSADSTTDVPLLGALTVIEWPKPKHSGWGPPTRPLDESDRHVCGGYRLSYGEPTARELLCPEGVNDRHSFGVRLRRERERRHISLEQLASETKVGADLWMGLERGDLSRWPAGIFARSFVRTYAMRVGLNVKEIVDEFCRLYPIADRRSETIIRAHAETIGVSSGFDDDRAHVPRTGDRRLPPPPPAPDAPGQQFAQRTVTASLDLSAIVLLSLVVARVAGRDVWSTLGFMAAAYYTIGYIAGGNTPAGLLIDLVRSRASVGPRISAAEKARVSHG
jgi:transcriptional regulator with XRE-family HTH domain